MSSASPGDASGAAPPPYQEPNPAGPAARLRLGLGLGIGALAVYAVVASAGGFADALEAVRSARPGSLALGALAEAGTYGLLGALLRRLLGGGVDRPTAVRLALVVAGLGSLLPAAPAEGLAIAGRELRHRGVDPHRSRIALGLMQWLSVRTVFGVAATDALGIAVVASLRYPDRAPRFLVAGAIALGVFAVLAATAWLANRRETVEMVAVLADRARFWQPSLPSADLRALGAGWHAEIVEVLGSRRTKAIYGGLALASCLADATCFRFALVAVGVHPKPGLFLFAYAVAMITAMVPLLPAGLGAVETVVPALLHHSGVPLATALAGILAYRALGTLLPAIFGTLALLRLRSTR